jgi:predicted GIY-YIG superfamily endonuclease
MYHIIIMVHWVYVLECVDRNIYVGETTRLFSRFNEHISGKGSVNTSFYKPKKIIGLYKVNDNYSFLTYRNSIIKKKEYNRFLIEDWDKCDGDNLLIENHFTEIYKHLRKNISDDDDSFMFDDGECNKVRGGKYTKMLGCPEFIDSNDIIDRPCCDCKYPCEVKLSRDKTKIYFVCSVKNVWDGFDSKGLNIEDPCDFFKVYDEDMYIKKKYEINIEPKIKESWLSNVPISKYKIHPEPCIKCNKTDYFAIFAFTKVRRLCQECIVTSYCELKETYSFNSNKCLIVDN